MPGTLQPTPRSGSSESTSTVPMWATPTTRVSTPRTAVPSSEPSKPPTTPADNGNNPPKLVVIYPNTAPNYAPHNPFAAYFENVVLHGKVMLQGVGPGGATSNTDIVYGTNIDASQFWSATQVVPAGRQSGHRRRQLLRRLANLRRQRHRPRAGDRPAPSCPKARASCHRRDAGPVRRQLGPDQHHPSSGRASTALLHRWRPAGQPRKHQHHPGIGVPTRRRGPTNPGPVAGRCDHDRSVRS